MPMYPKYTMLAFYQDPASHGNMNQYPANAALDWQGAHYLMYLWTSENSADDATLADLVAKKGESGYPVGDIALPPPTPFA